MMSPRDAAEATTICVDQGCAGNRAEGLTNSFNQAQRKGFDIDGVKDGLADVRGSAPPFSNDVCRNCDDLVALPRELEDLAHTELAPLEGSAVDVLTGIGWLDPTTLQRWKQGQLPSLAEGIQTKPARVAEAMEALRAWAMEKQLHPSETEYVARTPARPMLRFSTTGDVTIERFYRTHWLSRDQSEKERGRIVAKANRAPELVVIQPLNTDWKCHRCGATGDLLMMEAPGPACLSCVGLTSLEFLPAGDAALSRRARGSGESERAGARK